MKRSPVNPWQWSLHVGYHQAEIVEGARRQLTVSGQTAVDGEGTPQHPSDMREQMALALNNLETVLQEAGMGLQNVTKLGIFSTDVDQTMQHFDVVGARLGAAGATPPMTLLGVTQLAIPGLMFEIEAMACD